MKRAVITYIFGRGKELLREPLVVDKDVEYICVTDQTYLKSKVWRIVYEPSIMTQNLRDKVALVKFNPFKYTTAEKILILDASHQIKTSLSSLFNELTNFDIMLKLHTCVDNLKDELNRWVTIRHMSRLCMQKFERMSSINKLSLCDIPVYECCVLCVKNTTLTRMLFKSLLSLMKLLGDENGMIMTQQCTFAYLLKLCFAELNIGNIDHAKYFIRFNHNTNKRIYT